jgi:hypothetical protein
LVAQPVWVAVVENADGRIFIGMHLVDIYLIGVNFECVYLTGVSLMDTVYTLWGCTL